MYVFMKRKMLLLMAVLMFALPGWSQPDYSIITFKSKLPEYKEIKPQLKDIDISKERVKHIVGLLGKSFYSEEEITDITEKIWLAFNDPQKFDFVYKDMAIRTLPNWNKKNARGNIVLEPNPFLAEWTMSDSELHYLQKAFSMLLSYYQLMAYSDDAISTKRSLQKLLFTQKMAFRPAKSGDWTNSYLKYANGHLHTKGLTAMITNGSYDFLVCKSNDREELKSLFNKINWDFIIP